jgi:molybdate transport system ATP-binding protein
MNSSNVIQLRYQLQRRDFALDVDLELPLRGISGVFGTSGAGKTSLLRCIAGLERPSHGKLLVADEVWQDSSAGVWRDVHEREIGYVFQEPRLFPHLDVRGNIDYGRRRRERTVQRNSDQIVALLGLENLLNRNVNELSGGEAQRVAIARALACTPRFVLMDEPLASLDQERKDEILPFLDRLHVESDTPIIYVSHNIEEICRLCDHLVVLEGGRVAASGDLQSVLVGAGAQVLAGDQASSVISGSVVSYDENDKLTRLQFSGGELWLPGRVAAVGAELRLRVKASDVSLCRVRPEQSTILNILPAIVESIRDDGGPAMLVRLLLGSAHMLSRVTRRSVAALNLQQGDNVFAQIKSVAVRLSND